MRWRKVRGRRREGRSGGRLKERSEREKKGKEVEEDKRQGKRRDEEGQRIKKE